MVVWFQEVSFSCLDVCIDFGWSRGEKNSVNFFKERAFDLIFEEAGLLVLDSDEKGSVYYDKALSWLSFSNCKYQSYSCNSSSIVCIKVWDIGVIGFARVVEFH